jgi:hypothetical protein
MGTPSIRKALNGQFEEKEEKVITPEAYARVVNQVDEPFTESDLHTAWPEFIQNYTEQVHLYNTIMILPVLKGSNLVVITVENSVQFDQLRQIKPEIIGFLHRKLKNTSIDVQVEINRIANENKILTDEQRMQAMLKKNPALALFKNTFNLDFNG